MRIKEFIKRKSKYVILFILFSIFLLIAKEVFKKEIFYSDKILYSFFVLHRNSILNMFFIVITEFGSAEFLIIFTIILILFVKEKFYKILIPLNLAFIGLSNQILKNIFIRQRPNELRLVDENGYSFPSGHAMASTAFYGLLIFLVFKNVKDKKLSNMLIMILSITILLIDISRIYLGVHYASDVLAGTLLSVSYLIILIRILKTKFEENEAKEKVLKIDEN